MVYFAFSLAVVAGTSALLFYMRLLSKTQELEKALQECARLLTHSNKLESSYTESLQDIARLETLLQTTKERLAQLEIEQSKQIQQLVAQYQEQLKHQDSLHKTNLATLESTLEKHLATQKAALLNENKLALSRDSKAILDEVFTPIKTRVEEYQKALLQNEAKLKENIDNAFKYSQEMSKSAQELGRILKGDKKLRGNFGELQLKSVLQSSGLIEGVQYKLQEQLHTQGRRYIPDAVVSLDEERNIIIDAKFPLPNTTTGDDEIEINAQEIAQNLRVRIDELASKPYKDIENSYDFVLLFIPYNNILDLAINADSSLYQYAYSKQIYLTTPHTLFMALKTISITWQHIQSDQNIRQAFEEIGKFYDKFADVCSDFDKIVRGLQSAKSAASAMNIKLRGKGGLEARFDKLKDLGAKTKKSIQAPKLLSQDTQESEQE